MLGLTIAGLMASTVAAQPNLIASRQATTEGINKTELEAGPGRDITFIWARASTETGNMGGSLGPMLCDSLKEAYDDANVACQGVGGAYAADLISNLSPLGTSQGAIDEATRLVHLANTKCPDTAVVAGGYSQGTAVMAAAISGLSTTVQDQISGVVLFGYTRNQQNDGEIPNFPTSKTLIFCNHGDLVCVGTLNITEAHYGYRSFVPSAATFLEDTLAESVDSVLV